MADADHDRAATDSECRWSGLWCQFSEHAGSVLYVYICFSYSHTFILGNGLTTSASYRQPLWIQITFWKMSKKSIYSANGSWNKWYYAASRFKNRASCRTFWSLSCNWDNVLGLVDLPCVFVLSFSVQLAYFSAWAESRCLLVCKKTVHHQKVWKPDIQLDYQALTCRLAEFNMSLPLIVILALVSSPEKYILV